MRSPRGSRLALLGELLLVRALQVLQVAAATPLPPDQYVVARRAIEEMVVVPSGTFVMGATAAEQSQALEMCRQQIGKKMERNCTSDRVSSEGPAERVFVSGFRIDRVEVTVAAYRRCIHAGACDPMPLVTTDPRLVEEDRPVTNLTHGEAARFCAWRKARLPTEAEWERAARGGDPRLFPWGNQPQRSLANLGRFLPVEGQVAPSATPVVQADASDGWALTAPVGSFPKGASPFGVLDLAGNVAEWTADYFAQESPQRSSRYNPRGPASGEARSVRGGSWRMPLFLARTTARLYADPNERSTEIGFRCVQPLDP